MATVTRPLMMRMAHQSIRAACRQLVKRIELTVEGLDNVPTIGPAILAARHFHHLYDGCALIATIPRPVHILVAVDWIQRPLGRAGMEAACHAAGWPIVLRTEGQSEHAAGDERDIAREQRRYLIRATRESLALLQHDQLLVVFPEAFPNIDPSYTPKSDAAAFLPFRPGFLRLAELAVRDGTTVAPIIPTGFAYDYDGRWRVTLRFGPPMSFVSGRERHAFIAAVEQKVHWLSRPASPNMETAPRAM